MDVRTDNTNPRVTLQLKTHRGLTKIETVDQATPSIISRIKNVSNVEYYSKVKINNYFMINIHFCFCLRSCSSASHSQQRGPNLH